jgi:hypothetical protein
MPETFGQLAQAVITEMRLAARDLDLEAVARYLGKTLGAPRPADVGDTKGFYFELKPVRFEMGSKDGKVQYTLVSAGVSLIQSRYAGNTIRASEAVALAGGKVYGMVPPVEAKSSMMGTQYIVRNLDKMVLEGITEDQYTDLFKKMAAAAQKAQKLIVQFEREGGEAAPATEFVAQAKAFQAKWSRGENWGPVKNVVPLKKEYKTPSGTLFDVGVVFNLGAFRTALAGNEPDFLPNHMFKAVIRKVETDEVTPEKGFEALRTYDSLDFFQKVQKDLDEFNDQVIAPWRKALGAEDYRRRRG